MPISMADMEILLQRFIKSEENDKAVELLRQMAIRSAKENDFQRAESYRDQIYEVDSMALDAIVQVNELIETEKNKALTPDRRQLWRRFFDEFSKEEANAFFFGLKEWQVEPDQVILRQGQTNDRLFLINKGNLKVVHDNKDKEQLIQELGRGDIFGQDTFFSVNVCTVSITALSQTHLSYLERDHLEKTKASLPMLENTLEKICNSGTSTYDRLRQKGIDRRSHKRINWHTKVTVQMLTPDAKKALQRPITAELWDISKGGLSFYFQSRNREAVRRLIGRTLGVKINLNAGDKRKSAAVTGVVHGVQNHPLDEYSVHLKLNREFSHNAIQTIKFAAAKQ